jgi:hypothetical protein
MTASVNTILGTSTITSADDALASAQRDQFATLQGLEKFIQARSQRLQDDVNRLSNVQKLQPQVANLANGLTPDGATKLITTDSGATVVLPDDVNTSIQAQLKQVGYSLTTAQRYIVSSTTTNSGGSTLSSTSNHVASSAEMSDIANGTTGTMTISGKTYDSTTVYASNGNATTYLYDPNATATTASVSDIKSLNTSLADDQLTVSNDIQSASQDLEQANARLEQLARVGDAQYTALNDQHTKTQGDLREQKRQNAFVEVRLRDEDIARFQQNTLRKTSG